MSLATLGAEELKSGPARDLWIEIRRYGRRHCTSCCRVPQGTCGLKFGKRDSREFRRTSGPARDLWIEIVCLLQTPRHSKGRVPQGTCGLKCVLQAVCHGNLPSGPARDLWIEISYATIFTFPCMSGPARDLWIEIKIENGQYRIKEVGSRKGPVD